MKKEKKVEFGIEITKPWSKEMYEHNDRVAEAVKVKVFEMWTDACDMDVEMFGSDSEWLDYALPEMIKIEQAVLCYGIGYGYSVADVAKRIEEEIEDAPYYRLKEIAEDLELDLKQGFVGFN